MLSSSAADWPTQPGKILPPWKVSAHLIVTHPQQLYISLTSSNVSLRRIQGLLGHHPQGHQRWSQGACVCVRVHVYHTNVYMSLLCSMDT